MPGHSCPALVVDAAVAEHLEVLRRVAIRRIGVVERVGHRDALERSLLHAVDAQRLRQAGRLEHRGRDVDHVMELRADLALRLDAARPVHDRAVPRAAPVRGHLLRPLVRGVHRVRPADRVVVVGRGGAEVVDPRHHELRRLESDSAVEDDELVEAPGGGALSRGAVVPDDVVDERVVQDLKVRECVDQPADVVVGVFEEAGVHLHLACEHRLQVVGHVVPRRDLVRTLGQRGVGWNDAELLLLRVGPLTQSVPAVVEATLVLVRPFRGHVMRGVGRPGRVVDEERLVGHQRLLLADPVDGVIGHVLGEVVALLRRAVGLDRDRVLVDRRRVLVGLAADEAVEVLEPRAGRPGVERPHGARLPDGHLVALAELRRRVAVQLQRLGERSARVGADRVVAGRGRRDLGDAAHPDRVMVATGEECLARGGAERRGVEAVVLQAVRGEPLGVRRVDRSAEGARGAEAGVVDQDDQHIRCTLGRPQRCDRRELRGGVFRVVRRQPDRCHIRDRQDVASVLLGHVRSSVGLDPVTVSRAACGSLRPNGVNVSSAGAERRGSLCGSG